MSEIMIGEYRLSWIIEQRKHEIARLQAILRNPKATNEEKQIATDMLAQYFNGGNKQ
jgi:hypothetical protein